MAKTIEEIEEALEKTGGWQTQAAKQLGITVQAVSKRIKGSERLQKKLAEIKGHYLDLAEFKLIEKIKTGDLGAICFYLKCQGKERGYIEKQQIDANMTHNNAQKVTVEFVDKDPDPEKT